jgi:hypothetical protein
MRSTHTFDGVEYTAGRQFRVIKAGALSGFVPIGCGAFRGWGQKLKVGDVITCAGCGYGFGSDPGWGVGWESEQSKAARAVDVDFTPSTGSVFSYRPAPGYLEPVT